VEPVHEPAPRRVAGERAERGERGDPDRAAGRASAAIGANSGMTREPRLEPRAALDDLKQQRQYAPYADDASARHRSVCSDTVDRAD
jgi:hypothetical protein